MVYSFRGSVSHSPSIFTDEKCRWLLLLLPRPLDTVAAVAGAFVSARPTADDNDDENGKVEQPSRRAIRAERKLGQFM